MGKWGKWVLCFAIAMAFGAPAWAADLQLNGKYQIQGRYYKEADIKSVETGLDETSVTKMYLKHYFNLYPTITVNDNILVKADLEAFDNIISKNDSGQWFDKSSGNYAAGADLDAYDLFTINELYVDALTPVGKFIVGKTKLFNGIGWFIQVPQAPDWTFGLAWNKRDENGVGTSYVAKDTEPAGNNTSQDGSDLVGSITNHDNANLDDYYLIANYKKDALDFKGTLAYVKGGHSGTETSIFFPFFYLDYAVNKDLTINSKFGYMTGTVLVKDSNVAKQVTTNLLNKLVAGDATVQAYLAANPAAAALAGSLSGFENDLEADGAITAWVGAGYTMDALKIQADVVYLSGGDAPNKASAGLSDDETLGTWLMNDVSNANAQLTQTPATLIALAGPKRKGYEYYDSATDGNFSFANATLLRLNLGYTFNDKLDASLNMVYAMMTDTEYLEKWCTNSSVAVLGGATSFSGADARNLGAGFADMMKVGGAGLLGGLVSAPTTDYDVDSDMGYELRMLVNYKMMANLTVGLDLCYYAPGDLYKGLIERNFVENGTTNYKVENTYGARWTAKVTF